MKKATKQEKYEAVQAVIKIINKGTETRIAIATIANIAQMSIGTLRAAYYKLRPTDNHHGNSVLTSDQEAVIVAVLQAQSIANKSLTAKNLRDLIYDMTGRVVSRNWPFRFQLRHKKDLTSKTCKQLTSNRSKGAYIDDVRSFIAEYEQFTQFHAFKKSAIFNIDETLLSNKGDKLVEKRFESTQRLRAESEYVRTRCCGSLVALVCADGSCLMLVYCIRADIDKKGAVTANYALNLTRVTRRSGYERFFIFTKSGRIDTLCFKLILDKFFRIWDSMHPGLDVLIFSDQLGAHRDPDLIRTNVKRKVWLFSLPRNCSHWIQPLDDVVFALFKKFLKTAMDEIQTDAAHVGLPASNALMYASYSIEKKCFTKQVIIQSFLNCGLVPWNSRKIIELANKNQGEGLEATDLQCMCVTAALSVINRAKERLKARKQKILDLKHDVDLRTICSPNALLSAIEKKEKKKADEKLAIDIRKRKRQQAMECRLQQKQQSKKARLNRTCKQCNTAVWVSSNKWLICKCGCYYICPKCMKHNGAYLSFTAHKKKCK